MHISNANIEIPFEVRARGPQTANRQVDIVKTKLNPDIAHTEHRSIVIISHSRQLCIGFDQQADRH